MRWSEAFIPTLRDDPAEAEAVSHKLLIRGGFIRQLSAGHYSMLAIGQRVRAKIERIIREEMDRIGCQEMEMPVLAPAELWKETGRWDGMDAILFKVKDHGGREFLVSYTHEEVVTHHARNEIL
ncbi:MAG: proline--tRNA ligase, partial [Acidimicrobiia bacterium]